MSGWSTDKSPTGLVAQKLRDCVNDNEDALTDDERILAHRVINSGAAELRVPRYAAAGRELYDLVTASDLAEKNAAVDIIGAGRRALEAADEASNRMTAEQAATFGELEASKFTGRTMSGLINRLLATAPKFEPGPGFPAAQVPQTPALQCQIRLNSGLEGGGVLSTTPEGTLRFLMPVALPVPGKRDARKDVLAELFFAYEDVEAIVLIHDIAPPTSSSGIILPRS